MLNYTFPYFAASLIIAFLGVNRKMGFWGYFFSSLMLTPVMGILLLLASDPRVPEAQKTATTDQHTPPSL
jgi:hypothetical protein